MQGMYVLLYHVYMPQLVGVERPEGVRAITNWYAALHHIWIALVRSPY